MIFYLGTFLFLLILLLSFFKKKDKRISANRMNEIVDRMNQDTKDFYQKYNRN